MGYIDWATYEENQRMMRRNTVNWEATNRWRRSVRVRACSSGCFAVAIVAASFMCAIGVARGTHARYLCKGDYDDGGQYCIGFGGAMVDRRLSEELLKVISPLAWKRV